MINIMKRTFSSHKGVAPIIATLLMVAIAVVGGVLIYVYTQGFFGSTTTTGVSTDIVIMTGYDAREIVPSATTGLTNHLGTVIPFAGDASAADNGKAVNDDVAINIRNGGGGAVTITSLKVNGAGAPLVCTPVSPTCATVVSLLSTAAADNGAKWAILNPGTIAQGTTGVATLNAGQETTLVFQLQETLSNGRTVTVDIGTGAGGAFSYSITIGQRE